MGSVKALDKDNVVEIDMSKTDIRSLTQEEMKVFVTEIGEKPFRGKQIYQWLHEKQVTSFD